jgi:hypothetical protein
VRNIVGGVVGGPLFKDRLFFFLNYEGRRDSQGASINAGTVPNASYRAGNLQYQANTGGSDVVVYTLTPDKIKSMDPQNIGNNAALLDLLDKYPQGDDPTQRDGLNNIGYRFPYTMHRTYNTYIARFDWNLDFSVTRGLHNGGSLEVSWIGRLAHRQLAQEDVAMSLNLTAGGTSYFAVARDLTVMARHNMSVTSVAPVPYWEQQFAGLDGQDIGLGDGPLTATQNVYALFANNLYNETYALYQLDLSGSLPNTNIGAGVNYPAFRYYHDQYSALYSWRSVGYSNFKALEAAYRQRFGGFHADLNYTFSKSLDITSQAERLGNSATTNYAQIMNSRIPNHLYGPSDSDVRHQIKSNFAWDLPRLSHWPPRKSADS